MFQGSSREIFRGFKKVLRVFTGNFKGVSRKFQKCFKEVSRVFQGSFWEISRGFQEKPKGVKLKGISSNFKGIQGYLEEV